MDNQKTKLHYTSITRPTDSSSSIDLIDDHLIIDTNENKEQDKPFYIASSHKRYKYKSSVQRIVSPRGRNPSNISGIPKKRSFGIACCRINKKNYELEILMVKKRFSPFFFEFVYGHYKNAEKELRYLLSRMTNEEKLEILSLNFYRLWYRIWWGTNEGTNLYSQCKQKFERNFPNNIQLRRIIETTQSYESIWEIPKGRKSSQRELDLTCAIRELNEETGIGPELYTIMDFEPRIMKYCNMGTQYVNKYYIAMMRDYKEGGGIKNIGMDEIIDIKWMTLAHLSLFDQTKKLTPFIASIFKQLRKQFHVGKMSIY